MREDPASLKAEVLAAIRSAEAVCQARFDELAVRVWRWQIDAMPRYRAFCESRAGSQRVEHWHQIPPLPCEALKFTELAVDPRKVIRRFTTSGTTGRDHGSRPGVAACDADALEVMDAAIVENARRSLFADDQKCRILVLAPPPEQAPHVIMCYGTQKIVEAFGTAGSGFFANPDGIDLDRLVTALEQACLEREPVCLLGASFAFVHVIDALTRAGRRLPALPEGSRAMDAGGYKGRSRELAPSEFRRAVSDAFGLRPDRIVNALGMTELASQMYDRVESSEPEASRVKRPPPWARTRVMNADLRDSDARDGQLGLIAHWDLANFSRPIAILTGDVGRRHADGFEIVGRASASEPRGCSLRVASNVEVVHP